MTGSVLYFGMAVAAALAFTVGGIFMKYSQGLTQPLPSLAMLGLFGLGAALLTLSIELRGELGPAYLVVLGLEAVLALAFGAMLFGEHPNNGRLFGLALLIVGMILIETGSAEASSDEAPRPAGAHARPN
jgi:small multidrug resistance pump/quaternary ammonium compound-resistance protein SugE